MEYKNVSLDRSTTNIIIFFFSAASLINKRLRVNHRPRQTGLLWLGEAAVL